jgi:hypothetical protein
MSRAVVAKRRIVQLNGVLQAAHAPMLDRYDLFRGGVRIGCDVYERREPSVGDTRV